MLTLYQREECLESQRVRARLGELGWRYTAVHVLEGGSGRAELEAISGYAKVPTLYHQGCVFVGADEILAYFGTLTNDAQVMREHRRYALVRRIGLPLGQVREALTEALVASGLRVLGAHALDELTSVSLTVRDEALLREASPLDAFAVTWLTSEVVLLESGEGETTVCVRRPSLVSEHVDSAELLRLVERADATFVKVLSTLQVGDSRAAS